MSERTVVFDDITLQANNFKVTEKVLINTTNDTATLNVGGNVHVIGDVTVAGNLTANYLIGDGSLLTNISEKPWSSNGNSIYYDQGNVGIGTSAPVGALHVEGGPIVLPSLSENPANALDGSMYYNTTDNKAYIRVSDGWLILAQYIPLPLQISGCIGYYLPENWTGTQWSDASGNDNHVTNLRNSGAFYTDSYDGTSHGANATFPILSGTANEGMRFPSGILPIPYTIFHVTRYAGEQKQRIISASNINWLSGHWAGLSGVCFQNGFLTSSSTDYHGTKWVISTTMKNRYRSKSNGSVQYNFTGTTALSTAPALTLNDYGSEIGDWAVAEIIVYNRELTSTEYESVELYLQTKYGI